MMPSDDRPDPDALLAHVQAQERKAARGKLRIYFGASAGVGKTYAMLSAARKLQAAGQQVLVGVIETHGRSETAALVDGLPLLPPRAVQYRGKTISEFDIDAALAQRPPLILIDELAHSNAPGSRHPKRWQDVEELLDAGIDVFSTVNVQHLESLNDVVGGITGIQVNETVPDTVFDAAGEVVLVDIPADELLTRLRGGKVYHAAQAERAARNFFRKGNLIALRELALRRTADRIEDDVRAYRVEQSIDTIWKTGASVLALVGPRPGCEQVVRSAARLAGQLGTEWHAVYVETPSLQRLPASERERILKTLKLAADLGAVTAVLSGHDIAATAVEYARSHNLSRITMGRGHLTWPWRRSHIRSLAAEAPDIDLIEVSTRDDDARGAAAGAASAWGAGDDAASWASGAGAPGGGRSAGAGGDGMGGAGRRLDPDELAERRAARSRVTGYGVAVAASVGMALLATPLLGYFDLANIAMLFLLVVLLVAVKYGRAPSVLATCVSVACFDFFFVPPRFSLAVSDLQYAITFGVMLAVGLITGHLTAGLRFQARVAAHREARARALYEFARELSGALQTEQIFETTSKFVQSTFRARATLLVPDAEGRLHLPPGASALSGLGAGVGIGSSAAPTTATAATAAAAAAADTGASPALLDLGIAQWSFDRAESAGMGTDTLPASPLYYMPLVAPMRTRGVLAIEPQQRRWILIPEQRQHLDTFAALAAIALERVHYIEVAQEALVSMESERLRNSLLAALSHDLRTPLTSLVGLSESLANAKPQMSQQQQDLARSLHDESLRMSTLVSNLLDMARIESGELKFNLQWQPLEEVVGSALRYSANQLKEHKVSTQLPHDLPLLRFDAVLIERVLCNLLENAAKYTPPGSAIVLSAQRGAHRHHDFVRVMVYDNGPGLPRGREEAIFEKFTRGERESAKPGVGLGLAICRAIVQAHGGTIEAAQSPLGGAAFVFTLPVGSPPEMPRIESELNEPST